MASWLQSKNRKLLAAAVAGQAGDVDKLLASGAKIEYTDPNGATPLLLASWHGHADVVDRLLRHRANIHHENARKCTPLVLAAWRGYARIVAVLLSAGARVDHLNSFGETALMLAAGRGRLDVVKMLVESGADRALQNKDGETALSSAEKNKHATTAEWLRALDAPPSPPPPSAPPFEPVSDPVEETAETTEEDEPAVQQDDASMLAVFQAVEGGSSDMVEQLSVEYVNARGPRDRTPVHRAVELGRLDVLRVLIEKGASVTSHDDTGATPLHVACSCGQAYAASFLVMSGADIRAVDNDGLSPIEIAAARGHVDIVTELGRRGVDLTIVSPSGRTLLHHAVTGNSTAMVDFLLSQQVVDINAVDVCGWSALHCAVRSGNEPVVASLLEHGADPNLRTSDGPADPSASSARIVRGSESALHAAVRLGRVDIVSLLIACARTQVNARNAQGETPLMLAASLGRSEIVAVIVQANSEVYHERCVALTNDSDATPTIRELTELVVLITSVYDLRWILTLSSMCDNATTDDMTALLKTAMGHVVANKLVFDDDACVFFKMTLKHCEREGLLPLTDILLLDRQAEKVNTESAEWAVALKKQVAAHTWRLDAHDICLRSVVDGIKEVHSMVLQNRAAVVAVSNRVESLQVQVNAGKQLLSQLAAHADRVGYHLDQLERRLCQSEDNISKVAMHLQSFRDAYVGHIEQEQRNKKIKMVCGAVACVAGFVFAPVLKEIADAVVDLTNPIDIVKQIYGEEDIASFLAEKSQSILPDVVRGQLEKYAIAPHEFETLLREEIALQHPEIVQECAQRGMHVFLDGGKAEVARSHAPLLETEENAVSQVILELRSALNDIATEDAAKRFAQEPLTLADLGGGGGGRPSNIYTRSPSLRAMSFPAGQDVPDRPVQRPPMARTDERPLLQGSRIATNISRTSSVRSLGSSFGPNDSSSLGSSFMLDGAIQRDERDSLESSSPSLADSSFGAMSGAGNVVLLSDPDAFPYHVAVQKCLGDVSCFQQLTKNIAPNSVDANARMDMLMVVTTTTREALCAAQYAYLLGYRAVGDAVGARMNDPPNFDEVPAKSVLLEEDIDDYPYALAVAESNGDVDECEDCMDALDEDDHALDEQIQALVVRESSYTVSWTVYEYACHLGYVDVVKYLFKDVCSAVPAKTRIHAIKQARERAKTLAEQA